MCLSAPAAGNAILFLKREPPLGDKSEVSSPLCTLWFHPYRVRLTIVTRGKVYLVGAGPGDIGLLTVKGLCIPQRADVVIYDFHLNPQVLNYIRRSAEFIYAGKRGGHHAMTQEEINETLIRKAREGKLVCRLKGGDPFVFGRGGEEAERRVSPSR